LKYSLFYFYIKKGRELMGLIERPQLGNNLITELNTRENEISILNGEGEVVEKANKSEFITHQEDIAFHGTLARQAIINGNFDIAQRGTSFTNPTTGTYGLDRWKFSLSADGGSFPSNIIHSQQVLTQGDIWGSYYFYRINVDGAGLSYGANAQYSTFQFIEHGTRLLCGLNKKVTVSFYARSSITNKKLGIYLIQNYGTGGSPTTQETINGTKFTLTSSWTEYTFTFTTNTLIGKTFGTANDDKLGLLFLSMWGSNVATRVGDTVAESFVGAGDIEITQVQLSASDTALPFSPRDIEDVSRKSMRYLWIPKTNSIYIRMSNYTVDTMVFDVPLPTNLRINPTARGTVNTDFAVYDLAGSTQTGFAITNTLNSHGVTVTMTKTTHGLTDGYLVITTSGGFDAEL
jgi:hypothetical protein